jgi:hypothetical protein
MRYHAGITGQLCQGKRKRPKPLTCKDSGRWVCPEGDLNPHAR